eukprot:512048-Pelagomonas_calceolata.AAC.1
MSTGTALCAPLCQTPKKAERINFSEDCEMIHVEWHLKWEAADMSQMHPDLHAHVQAFEEERLKHTVDPRNDEINLNNLVNQVFEGNSQSLSDSSLLSTTGCAIRKN